MSFSSSMIVTTWSPAPKQADPHTTTTLCLRGPQHCPTSSWPFPQDNCHRGPPMPDLPRRSKTLSQEELHRPRISESDRPPPLSPEKPKRCSPTQETQETQTMLAEGRIFSISDPSIVWITSRPYLSHGSIGSGAFGEVFKLEMLTPLGLTLKLCPNGHPQFCCSDEPPPPPQEEDQEASTSSSDDGLPDVGGPVQSTRPGVLLEDMSEAQWRHTVGFTHVGSGTACCPKPGVGVVHAELFNPSGWVCALKVVAARSVPGFKRCLQEIRIVERIMEKVFGAFFDSSSGW